MIRSETVAVPIDVLERAVRKMELEYRHAVERDHGETPPQGECWAEVEALRWCLIPAAVEGI